MKSSTNHIRKIPYVVYASYSRNVLAPCRVFYVAFFNSKGRIGKTITFLLN